MLCNYCKDQSFCCVACPTPTKHIPPSYWRRIFVHKKKEWTMILVCKTCGTRRKYNKNKPESCPNCHKRVNRKVTGRWVTILRYILPWKPAEGFWQTIDEAYGKP